MPMGGGKRQVLVPSWWCTWPAAEMGARLVPAHGRRCTPYPSTCRAAAFMPQADRICDQHHVVFSFLSPASSG